MATTIVIPRPDGKFDDFQSVLVMAIIANAGPWNIPLAEITLVTDKQTPWQKTWAIAKDKKNCTTSQRNAKDVARKNYETVLRPFIQKWIYLNSSMDSTAIEQCGLKPHGKTRSKVPVPQTLPLIDIVMGKGNILEIIFRQQLNEPGSSKRGKPAGVAKCEFYFNLNNKPNSPDDCPKFAQSGRSPIKVKLPTGQSGQLVWYYARWINTTGEGGPWTAVDSFVIPF